MTYDRRKKKLESDRRRWPRLKPSDLPFLKKVEFNKGSKNEIINISRGGLLLETESCLGPHLKIMTKIVTTKGVFEMEGVTLRSSVCSLEGIPRYRTAVIFKHPFELMDEGPGLNGEQVQEEASESKSAGISEKMDGTQPQHRSPVHGNEKSPAVLTVVASDANGVRLKESFELNDW